MPRHAYVCACYPTAQCTYHSVHALPVKPWPTAQLWQLSALPEHAVHSVAHSEQPRLDVGVGTLLTNCRPVHVVRLVQARSVVALGSVLAYCTPSAHTVRLAHSRLDPPVGAVV